VNWPVPLVAERSGALVPAWAAATVSAAMADSVRQWCMTDPGSGLGWRRDLDKFHGVTGDVNGGEFVE